MMSSSNSSGSGGSGGGSSSGGSDVYGEVLGEELTILRSALTSLFNTTHYLSRSGVVILLTQLTRLSAQNVAKFTEETSELDIKVRSSFIPPSPARSRSHFISSSHCSVYFVLRFYC
jgi:hypothetical protein